MSQEPAALSPAPRPDDHIHWVFEDHARRTPSALAVVCGAERLSYGELDRRANRLARHLRQAGLTPGGLVAVCLGPGHDALITMLGVLKAGGAYVPVEPAAPEPVRRHILADADPYVVVTREAHRIGLADEPGRRLICLDSEADAIAARPDESVDVQDTGTAGLACVLYTSGTTGPPKGVLIEHGNLVSAYAAWHELHRLSPDDRHLQTAAPDFAGFTVGWIRALCSGGTFVMAGPGGPQDRAAGIAALHGLIVGEAVTLLECGVPTIRELHRHIRSRGLDLGAVRLVSVTGDTWYLDEQRALRGSVGPHVQIVNTYGLTEAVGGGAYFELPDQADPAGHPEGMSLLGASFPNTTIGILDGGGAPVDPGVAGEISIAGPAVARGYLGGEMFSAVRPLRTGDLGRIRDDGHLEYLGRTGSHADAEAALHAHPSVQECLVTDIEAGQRGKKKTLAAYVVAADGRPADAWELRSYLSGLLPLGRVPRVVVPMRSLPRTRADRLDRRDLPLPVLVSSMEAASGGKGGRAGATGAGYGGSAMVSLTLIFTFLAWIFTGVFWPGSTDLSQVPQPWATLFGGLYLCENLSFGAGMAFLFCGRGRMNRLGRSRLLTSAAHLAVVWLLVAWWPQDNFYRLAAKTDWPRQAALVYGFNVTLMAAAVLAGFVVSRPAESRPPDARTSD